MWGNGKRSSISCKAQRIGVVAMQVSTRASGDARQIDRGPEWQVLLAAMHREGIKLHALDGDPHYARPSEHDTVLGIVDAVIAHNASVAAAERFDGIHFDIEPYCWRSGPPPGAPAAAGRLSRSQRSRCSPIAGRWSRVPEWTSVLVAVN